MREWSTLRYHSHCTLYIRFQNGDLPLEIIADIALGEVVPKSTSAAEVPRAESYKKSRYIPAHLKEITLGQCLQPHHNANCIVAVGSKAQGYWAKPKSVRP
jgi:hypothetical protein